MGWALSRRRFALRVPRAGGHDFLPAGPMVLRPSWLLSQPAPAEPCKGVAVAARAIRACVLPLRPRRSNAGGAGHTRKAPPVKKTVAKWTRRSGALMQHARSMKALHAARRTQPMVATAYKSLAKAWNHRMGLRRGDRALDFDKQDTAHPRKWDFAACCRHVYRLVGKTEVARGSVGDTRRGLEMLSSMTALALRAQDSEVKAQYVPKGGNFISVGFDATPVLVCLGRFAPKVCEFARYLVPRQDRPGWRAVSLDVFRTITALKAHVQPQYGVVELFAQAVDMFWTTSTGCRQESYVRPPQVLQKSNGSTMFAAVHHNSQLLSPSALESISQHSGPFILQECPDSCKANLRMLAYLRARLPDKCLFAGSRTCAVHICHLIIVQSSREEQVVGDAHACEVVSRQPALFSRLVTGLKEWLDRELIIHAGRPPARLALHVQRTLQHTLRRDLDHVRGRLPSCAAEAEGVGGKAGAQVDKACEKIAAYWNGDIKRDTPEHYCHGCCDNREDTICKMVAAAVEGGLLRGFRSATPSKNRWGTCLKALSCQCAGFMFHDVLGNAVAAAFTQFEDGDSAEAGVAPLFLGCSFRLQVASEEPPLPRLIIRMPGGYL